MNHRSLMGPGARSACAALAVLGAAQRGETLTAVTRRIGPALVFERLWRELGVGGVILNLRDNAAPRRA